MIYLPRYPQIIAGLSHVSQQFLVLLLHEAHLSDGECEEEVSSESVGVEGEAVVDEGGAEPEVVADQRLLAQVRPQEQLHEPVLPRPPACALELETKVAEDYAKFYNHGEGPILVWAFSVIIKLRFKL